MASTCACLERESNVAALRIPRPAGCRAAEETDVTAERGQNGTLRGFPENAHDIWMLSCQGIRLQAGALWRPGRSSATLFKRLVR